jgi:hypothetical protein
MRFLAVLILCLLTYPVMAKPSPSLVTPFAGDRYAAQTAQIAPGVAGFVHRQRKPKKPRRIKVKHVPGMVAGIARQVAMAVGRPAAWCGWWLGQHLGVPYRHLWVARNWAKIGSDAGGPRVGAIVVWAHHVGIITGRQGNQWVVKSGNDGGRVRERARSVAGAIAFRNPHGNAT